jgi:hypothetical protein
MMRAALLTLAVVSFSCTHGYQPTVQDQQIWADPAVHVLRLAVSPTVQAPPAAAVKAQELRDAMVTAIPSRGFHAVTVQGPDAVIRLTLDATATQATATMVARTGEIVDERYQSWKGTATANEVANDLLAQFELAARVQSYARSGSVSAPIQ